MIDLQFIGGGRMAEALLAGLLGSGARAPGQIRIVDVDPDRLAQLESDFPGVELGTTPVESDGVVLATKPHHALDALSAAAGAGVRRVLSVAAGVPLDALQGAVGADVVVVRAMPNTPALVGAGAAAMCAAATVEASDLDWARDILSSVGTVDLVGEQLMNAVTGLSGSGPAYVFLVAESLIDAGVAAGLPRATAERLTRQTLLGAARLLDESGDSPQSLRAAVTSPGGTTAAGLRALEERAVRAAFADAVEAAARRAAELG